MSLSHLAVVQQRWKGFHLVFTGKGVVREGQEKQIVVCVGLQQRLGAIHAGREKQRIARNFSSRSEFKKI
jgi:hypothetical protein